MPPEDQVPAPQSNLPALETPESYYGEQLPTYGLPAPGRGYGYGYGSTYDTSYGHSGAGILGEISISRILRILRKKWLTLVLSAVFGLSAAFYYLQRTVPIYSASATIEMNVRKPRIMGREGAIIDDGGISNDEAFYTRLAKFRGSRMGEIAAEKFASLRSLPLKDATKWRGMLMGGVTFRQQSKTHIVTISFVNSDPRVAADAANAYAQAAEVSVFEENKSTSESAVAWLQHQAAAQREILSAKERELSDFRTKNNIDVLEGQMKSDGESIFALSAVQVELEGEIVKTEETLKVLTARKLTAEAAATLPPGIPREDNIAAAINVWLAAAQERAELLKRYTEDHPTIKGLEARIDNAEKRLLDEVVTARETLSNKLDLLKQQRQRLQESILAKRKTIAELEQTIVDRKTQLTNMTRERDAADITYRGILSRIEEARLSADENTAIVKQLEPAHVPSRPVFPSRSRAWFLGLFLGLAAGSLLALITDTLEDHVTSLLDVERFIGLKVIGLIPHVERAQRQNLATLTMNSRFSQISEAIAGIRNVLAAPQYRDKSGVVLITSSVPGEGKTITSCNLAIALARSGLKTLLIDFDMRRPRLAGIFAEPTESKSLLHVLASPDVQPFDTLPQNGGCENLDFITSSPSSDISAAEILGGPLVPRLVAWARTRYDRVIIDSPPYGLVGDAAVLAGLADCVILICRPEKSRRRTAKHVVQQLREMGAHIIGAVVNDISFGKGSYFSSYYHYSYHGGRPGYGYGYGKDDGEDAAKRLAGG